MLFLVPAALLAGCGQESGSAGEAEAFLKQSMDKYGSFETYHAESSWSMGFGDADRIITYQKPNKFRLENHGRNGYSMFSISDGKKQVEYTSEKKLGTQSYTAPASLASADSMQVGHPMFNGSMIYKFFAGSEGFANLVDASQGKVAFGKDEKAPNGEDSRLVKFYAKGAWGNTELLIGKESGLVHRIQYDMDGLRKMMEEPALQAQMEKSGIGKDLPQIKITETFSKQSDKGEISAKTFSLDVPKNFPAPEPTPGSGGSSALLGKPAPVFSVQDVSGKSVSLASLKGKPILIDFWATWCPPCVEGLPKTQELHEKYRSKGLQVLAVSDEDANTVTTFLSERKLNIPAYLDSDRSANAAYNVSAIPTIVLIDRDGKVADYIVGLPDESRMAEALKKVGID